MNFKKKLFLGSVQLKFLRVQSIYQIGRVVDHYFAVITFWISGCKKKIDIDDFFSYSSETIARCWYILLSGSVLMKDSMFLPPCRYVKLSLLLFKVTQDLFF